jgi:hypothetical protein
VLGEDGEPVEVEENPEEEEEMKKKYAPQF